MKFRTFLGGRITWLTLFSLAWAVTLVFDLAPILRGGFGWVWKYEPVTGLARILPLILGLLAYIPLVLILIRSRSTGLLLILEVVAGVYLTFAALHVRGDSLYRLYSITVSGWAAGRHLAATRIHGLAATLRDWPAFMARSTEFSSHMGTSPPGLVVLYYGADRLLEHIPALANLLARPVRWLLCQSIQGYDNAEYASAWIGMLMPLWGSLTVIPLYYFGRQSFGDDVARWSTAWWPLIPSFLSFAPLPNIFYPLPSVIMIGVLLMGLRRDRMSWVLAAGALGSVLSFINFTFLPLFLFSGLLTLAMFWWKRGGTQAVRDPWHWPFKVGLWFSVGLSTVWVICYALTGLRFLAVWNAIDHAQLALERPYWPWLLLHLNDYFMFAGWPLVLLAGVTLWLVVRRLRGRERLKESDLVLLAASLTLLLVDLSGTLRGESGRILLFLAPWLLLAAGMAVQDDFHLGITATVLEGLMALVIVGSLFVVITEFDPYVAAAPPDISYPSPAIAPSHDSAAEFGDAIRIVSYAGKVETGNDQTTLSLWLRWKDIRPVDAAYDVVITPVSPNGTSLQPYRVAPLQGKYPTTCWRPDGDALVDQVRIPLPSAQAGDWWLWISLIDSRTGKPLAVATSEYSSAHEIGLGPFH